MRKAIFLFVLASVGLLPVAAMAAGGSAEATLTISAVIDVSIDDQWDDLTLGASQLASGAIIDWDGNTPDIIVTVTAITDYKLYGCYYAKEGGNNVDPSFGDPNDLIILHDGTSDYTLIYQEITDPGSYTGPYNTLTQLATGNNGVSTYNYDVKLKLENLGDREVGETIDFTIVFVVEDV